MPSDRTDSYDAFVGLNEHGIERLLRAALLEQIGEDGLPFMLNVDEVVDFDIGSNHGFAWARFLDCRV